MRRLLLWAAPAILLGAPSGFAQDVTSSTVLAEVAGKCSSSPNASTKVTQCSDSIRLHFIGNGQIHLLYPNSKEDGIMFEQDRQSRTTTMQKYDGVPQGVPVSTSNLLAGNVLSLSYSFDNNGKWPNGARLAHRQTWSATIRFDGAGGCTVLGYTFTKFLQSNDRLLDDRTQREISTQSCRILAGNAL